MNKIFGEKIKSCPFCGEEGVVFKIYVSPSSYDNMIGCENCQIGFRDNTTTNLYNALTKWNLRCVGLETNNKEKDKK